jgi:ankyrin repeat protein
MKSKKFMRLCSVMFFICSCGGLMADTRSVVAVVNKTKKPVVAVHGVVVPVNTKAKITTEFIRLKAHQNIQLDLLRAILKDDAAMIKKTVQAGANVNQEIGKRKPLVISASNHKIVAFETLLELGADYNITYNDQKLVHWCIMGCPGYCSSCTTGTCGISNCGTSFCTGCSGKTVSPAVLLIRRGANLSGWSDANNDIMHYAVGSKDIELAAELVKRGYDINKIGAYTVWNLVGRSNILEWFLKNGFNSNQLYEGLISDGGKTWTPLIAAITQNNIESAKLLLEAGAAANPYIAKSSLSCAIEDENLEMIELLLKYGARK